MSSERAIDVDVRSAARLLSLSLPISRRLSFPLLAFFVCYGENNRTGKNSVVNKLGGCWHATKIIACAFVYHAYFPLLRRDGARLLTSSGIGDTAKTLVCCVYMRSLMVA